MARRRSIQHTAPKDEDVATMSLPARYAWAYLPCYADREGRLDDKPFYLKTEIFPIDPIDMEAVLAEIAGRRHIVRYVGSDGRKYIWIRNFLKYQTPHHTEAASRIPPPPKSVLGGLQEGPQVTPRAPQDGPGLWSVVSGHGSPIVSQDDDSGEEGLDGSNSNPPDAKPDPAKPLNASVVIGPHGYETPSWHPDQSWRHLTGIWSNAGRWPDGENFPAARKEFLKRVNAVNWPEVCAGVDWAVTESVTQRNRLHLGTLTMFLREERWKAQVPPIKSAAAAHAASLKEEDAPLPIE
jgi:hypothetical protein